MLLLTHCIKPESMLGLLATSACISSCVEIEPILNGRRPSSSVIFGWQRLLWCVATQHFLTLWKHWLATGGVQFRVHCQLCWLAPKIYQWRYSVIQISTGRDENEIYLECTASQAAYERQRLVPSSREVENREKTREEYGPLATQWLGSQ